MLPVVIPFYKNQDQLEKCKRHIDASGIEVEYFIRDNSSDNVGFTRAVNEGLLKYVASEHPYILVINQDCYVEPDALEKLLRFMDESPDYGIVAPMQVDGEKVINIGNAHIYPTGFHVQLNDIKHAGGRYNVFWVEAACWLVRVAMVREIGVLDRNMVLFGSDSDYCLRARMAGWFIGVESAAVCEHPRGCTVKKTPEIERQQLIDTEYQRAKWMSGGVFQFLDYSQAREPIVLNPKNVLRGDGQ